MKGMPLNPNSGYDRIFIPKNPLNRPMLDSAATINWIDLWVPLGLLGLIGLAAIAFARL